MGKPRRWNSYDSSVRGERGLSESYGQIRQDKSGIRSSFRDSPTGIPQGQGHAKSDADKLSAVFGGSLSGPLAFDAETSAISSGDLDITMTSAGTQKQARSLIFVATESGTADTLDTVTGRIYPGQVLVLAGIAGNTITITHNDGGAGGILCPDDTDFTLSDDEMVILVDDVTAATQTWRMISGGSSGGGGTGTGTGESIHATMSADQTTNLAVNDHIEFDTATYDGDITLQTGSGQADGIFELDANKTYILTAGASVDFATSGNRVLKTRWYDITNSAFIGTPSRS